MAAIEVSHNLWVGATHHVPDFVAGGGQAVLSLLGGDNPSHPHHNEHPEVFPAYYGRVIMPDGPGITHEQVYMAVEFLRGAHHRRGLKTLVHCRKGHHRGPTIAAVYLVMEGFAGGPADMLAWEIAQQRGADRMTVELADMARACGGR